MKSDKFIHDRGRGPEIKGTRITVYSILDYMIEGWHCERIADFFRLHPEEVQAAMEYVREHNLEVLREYIKILEREARGNPPELRARLKASHGKARALAKRLRQKAVQEEAMRGLLADLNCEGHVQALEGIFKSKTWQEVWKELGLSVQTFALVGLSRKAPDLEIWLVCQKRELVLITRNRNSQAPDSLQATINRLNRPDSLPSSRWPMQTEFCATSRTPTAQPSAC